VAGLQAFGRHVTLTIGTVAYTSMRIHFRVHLSRLSTPNRAVITAYNLDPSSIALLQVPTTLVTVLAGYSIQKVVFAGLPNAVKRGAVRVTRQGPDRVTRIECQDVGLSGLVNAWQNAPVNVSNAAPATIGDILTVCAAAMKIGTPYVAPTLTAKLANVIYPYGYHLAGPARQFLDRIASALDANWSIQGGILTIMPAYGPSAVVDVITFAAATIDPVTKQVIAGGNLIGSPTPMNAGMVKFTGLLEPALRPGMPFNIVAPADSSPGLYYAYDVVHEGDSGFENSFYTIATGISQNAGATSAAAEAAEEVL